MLIYINLTLSPALYPFLLNADRNKDLLLGFGRDQPRGQLILAEVDIFM